MWPCDITCSISHSRKLLCVVRACDRNEPTPETGWFSEGCPITRTRWTLSCIDAPLPFLGRMVYNRENLEGQMTVGSMPGDTIPVSWSIADTVGEFPLEAVWPEAGQDEACWPGKSVVSRS